MNEWGGRIIVTLFYGYMVTFYNIYIYCFLNNSEKSICKTTCSSQCTIGSACWILIYIRIGIRDNGLCVAKTCCKLESSWNVIAHGYAREGKWRGNWQMEWVASTLHTASEHGVSNVTTADAHTSAASSRLDWCPRRFKWTRPLRWNTKSAFCTCAITFQIQSTSNKEYAV